MRTLIINGSPRKDGDTSALIKELKKHLGGDFLELSAYYNKIAPCNDCRSCWKKKGCVIKDDMELIYSDDFDTVVIATPLYMSGLPGPLVSLASRFQSYYATKRFIKEPMNIKPKHAILIIVGGGDGRPDPAIDLTKWMFRYMNATFDDNNAVFSLKTDQLPASMDQEALMKISEIADRFNGG